MRGGSDLTPPPVFESWQKNYLFDWFETFWQFLNNHFTHFIFSKIFSRASPSPTFWVPQRIPCGGGSDLTPLPKSSIFIVERSNLHFFHTKLNFQQLLFSSYFGKIKFWAIFGPKSWTLVEGVRSDPPHVHPIWAKKIFWAIRKYMQNRLKTTYLLLNWHKNTSFCIS